MAVDAFDRVYRKARRRQLTVVTLLICELCLLTLSARAAATGLQQVNPLDRFLPEGALKPIGVSPDRFNPTVPLRFTLKGAEFDRAVADVILTINDVRVTGRHIRISAHKLASDIRLADGANKISLRAYDTVGRTLYYNRTLWGGNWTLRVELVDTGGAPVNAVCRISVVLPGDETVSQDQMTNRGNATFPNLPAQKVVINVRATDGASGTAEAFGSAGIVRVQLQDSSTKQSDTQAAEPPTDDIR